jgi:hypothetical protein
MGAEKFAVVTASIAVETKVEPAICEINGVGYHGTITGLLLARTLFGPGTVWVISSSVHSKLADTLLEVDVWVRTTVISNGLAHELVVIHGVPAREDVPRFSFTFSDELNVTEVTD